MMDSPRYRLEGSPLGGYELDAAALDEKAEELDKENSGWEDSDKDSDKDDPNDRLDLLQQQLEQHQQQQQQPADHSEGGGGMYSSPAAMTPGSVLLGALVREDGSGAGDENEDHDEPSQLNVQSLFPQTWDGLHAQPPSPAGECGPTSLAETTPAVIPHTLPRYASARTPPMPSMVDLAPPATPVYRRPPTPLSLNRFAMKKDEMDKKDEDKDKNEDKAEDEDMGVISPPPPPPPAQSPPPPQQRSPLPPSPPAPTTPARLSPQIMPPNSGSSSGSSLASYQFGRRPARGGSPEPARTTHAVKRPMARPPTRPVPEPVPEPMSVDDKNEEDKDEEDEDEEDEDGEEDDDSGEEEADDTRVAGRRQAKRRRPNKARNRFIEDEAEVDDDDEDLDEEDAEYAREAQELIADGEDDGNGPDRTSRNHQRLDRRRREVDDRDAERIAADLKARHQQQQVQAYSGDNENLPQSLLVPSVEDPKLWQVRVKPKCERQLVYSIMRKVLDLENEGGPAPRIYSAFTRDTLSGLLYVEADTRSAVEEVLDNLLGVYLLKGIQLVPVDDMPDLLKLTKERVELKPNSWVRIKRGRYRGDLAKVLKVSDNRETVTCKFIPRINLSPADDERDDGGKKKKRKAAALTGKAATRPPAKLFSAEEIIKAYSKRAVSKKGDFVIFQDDVYAEGFLEKALKISTLEAEGVIPTMEELEIFAGPASTDKDDEVPEEDYSALQAQARLASVSALQTGDIVEVTQDQNKGAIGLVVGIVHGVVTLRRMTGEAAGTELTVRGEFIRKKFRQGEHVKVVAGKNLDETGMVLGVEGDVVRFLADLSREEVTAFAKDIRVTEEVGSGLNAIGQYAVHDLVTLDEGKTIGVIIRIERQRIDVLDTRGGLHSISPARITSTVVNTSSVTLYDQDGEVVREGDAVVETQDEQRSGVVLAIRGNAVFLCNSDLEINQGIFVTPNRNILLSSSGRARLQTDLTKLNPDLAKHVPASSGIKLQPSSFRDPLVFTPVVVVKGIYKSCVGLITDVNGEVCRVELQATNQTITVKKDGLRKKDPATGAISKLPVVEESSRGVPYRRPSSELPVERSPSVINPYANDGGRTPAYVVGCTPNPLAADNATPSHLWAFDAGTPDHAIGGRTPAYNVLSGGMTPRGGSGGVVVHGGRTPTASYLVAARTPTRADALSSRTPAYASFTSSEGRTPGYAATAAAGGGRTPAYGAMAGSWTPVPSSSGRTWGAATPMGAGSSAYTDIPRQTTGSGYDSTPTPGPSKISFAPAPQLGSNLEDWD